MALAAAIASSSPFTSFPTRRVSRGRTPPALFAASGAPVRCDSRLFCRSGPFYFPACRSTGVYAARMAAGVPCLTSAIARRHAGWQLFGEFHRWRDSDGGSFLVRATLKSSKEDECLAGEKFRILNVFGGRVFRVLTSAAICVVLVTTCRRVLAQEGVSHASVSFLGGSAMVVRDVWPKILQVLCVFKEQGLVLAALLGLSAFFSMAETSITTLWPWKVRELAEKEPENGVFRMLRSDVTRVVNIGATALVTEAATTMFGEAGVSAATGVMTVAILLLTEITPKSVAVHNATEVARFVVRSEG
ncbi:hypothetical protein Taro_020917 [Colocasia esculenta]|uniref:CNNM transmembrane domain-containing protein n=1 Tax=Colocasia esculenta TaxID=4460 RepID=A0A843V9X5_COLES|nr:hypothetical protein [Colocasia esculenta]